MRTTDTSKHPLYISWTNMKQRCYNKNRPDYKYYGKIGIIVCTEWINNFVAFKDWSIENNWNKDLTLDRTKGGKGYSPKNCKWVTREIQARNQKKMESNTSGFIGVSKDKRNGSWQSYISVNGSLIQLGYHYTAKEAALIRDNYILKNKLEGFKLNF